MIRSKSSKIVRFQNCDIELRDNTDESSLLSSEFCCQNSENFCVIVPYQKNVIAVKAGHGIVIDAPADYHARFLRHCARNLPYCAALCQKQRKPVCRAILRNKIAQQKRCWRRILPTRFSCGHLIHRPPPSARSAFSCCSRRKTTNQSPRKRAMANAVVGKSGLAGEYELASATFFCHAA